MQTSTSPKPSLPLLVVGDILALLLFVVVGLASHQENKSWLFNLARVSAPFLLGWFAVAPFTGAYQLPLPRRSLWLRRSALTWLLGICLGLLLRALLFRNGVTPIFMGITLFFTGIFVLGWRTIFAIVLNRARRSEVPVPSTH